MMEVASIAIYGFPTKPSTWTEIIIAHQRKGERLLQSGREENRMRLIDADALKDYIDAQEGRPFIGCTVGEALKIMTDEQPTIQPKRGRWIKLDMHRGMADHKCTACKQECYVPTCMGEPMYAFCPNCGAKMEATT